MKVERRGRVTGKQLGKGWLSSYSRMGPSDDLQKLNVPGINVA